MNKKACLFIAIIGVGVIGLPSLLASKEHRTNERVVSANEQLTIEPSLAPQPGSLHSLSKEPIKAQVLISGKSEHTSSTLNSPSAIAPSTQQDTKLNSPDFYEQPNTQVITTSDPVQLEDGNQKPTVNQAVAQSIQNEINQWSITASSPANYRLDVTGLFEDPNGDLLTTQFAINHSGLTVSNAGTSLLIQGTPTKEAAGVQLMARAKDDYHGLEEEAWVTTTFGFPNVGAQQDDEELHPLIGKTWYRLESSHQFAGKNYNYEVVFCEAFKFINDDVFFASSKTLTTCPQEKDLQLVGSYHLVDDNLVVTSSQSIFDADMNWKVLEQYPTSKHYSTAYVASVQSGQQYETYTLASSRSQMEQRINTVTGQASLQMTMHDYMYLAKNGRYYLGWFGMHLSNYQQSNPNNPNIMDGDLNVQSSNISVTCQDLLADFDHLSVAGRGMYGEIIGNTESEAGEPIECDIVFVKEWQKHYSFFDIDFLEFDTFKDGEIFSIILRPKAHRSHEVEEIKLNVRYLLPD